MRVQATSRFHNGLTLQHNLIRHVLDAAASLLGKALEDTRTRARDVVAKLSERSSGDEESIGQLISALGRVRTRAGEELSNGWA